MIEGNNNQTLLDVPYFQQTRTATCGPACLMMVMKYWKHSFTYSRRVEFNLWMKSFSLLLFGGTYQFGLAKAAVDMGYKSEIYQKTKFSQNYSRVPRLFDFIEFVVSHSARCVRVPIHCNRDVTTVIQELLRHRVPPIVFMTLKPLAGESAFHWVVVTGMDNQNVYMNDPYVPIGSSLKMKKGYPVSWEIFQKAIATDTGRNLRLPPCVVSVYK